MKKLLACLLFAPAMAHAEFFTGNELLRLLQSNNLMDKTQALGYIQGVTDAYMGVVVCPPDGVNAGQVNDMVKNYLENTPATRNRTADLIISDALKSIWPCKSRGNGRPI